MAKAILFSILIATIAIPIYAAAERKPARGLKKMVVAMAAFAFFWFLALIYVYGALG